MLHSQWGRFKASHLHQNCKMQLPTFPRPQRAKLHLKAVGDEISIKGWESKLPKRHWIFRGRRFLQSKRHVFGLCREANQGSGKGKNAASGNERAPEGSTLLAFLKSAEDHSSDSGPPEALGKLSEARESAAKSSQVRSEGGPLG